MKLKCSATSTMAICPLMASCKAMGKRLFIVRDAEFNEICSKELFVDSSCLATAYAFMDLVRQQYPISRVDHCEIWQKSSANTMHLLTTVF